MSHITQELVDRSIAETDDEPCRGGFYPLDDGDRVPLTSCFICLQLYLIGDFRPLDRTRWESRDLFCDPNRIVCRSCRTSAVRILGYVYKEWHQAVSIRIAAGDSVPSELDLRLCYELGFDTQPAVTRLRTDTATRMTWLSAACNPRTRYRFLPRLLRELPLPWSNECGSYHWPAVAARGKPLYRFARFAVRTLCAWKHGSGLWKLLPMELLCEIFYHVYFDVAEERPPNLRRVYNDDECDA